MITAAGTQNDRRFDAAPPAHGRKAATIAATDLMNRMYRHQRHIYDLTRKFYLLGRDSLIAQLRPAPGDAVLEIGCGTGRNLILAARRYPQARFFGVDVSTAMLTSAIASIEQDGLSPRARVAHGDARDFDPAVLFGEPHFARVMISYSLSMIPGWPEVLALALSLLAPGGRLHVVDFGGQERLPAWFRVALRAWLARFHVTPRDDLEATLAALCARAGATLTFERPFRGYAQSATATLSQRSA
jgi:S-adenosylmethionine-diacylgycerolhomoserine-N-methlytransferase